MKPGQMQCPFCRKAYYLRNGKLPFHGHTRTGRRIYCTGSTLTATSVEAVRLLRARFEGLAQYKALASTDTLPAAGNESVVLTENEPKVP